MEPRIQYAKTSDGVSIAYYAIGDGPPLVVIPAGLHQSIQFDWKVSNFRNAAEISARTFRYVRYDPRGSGLSDRDINDFSLEAMTRDLEGLASALGSDPLMLFCPGIQGLAGAAFAARHQDKVSHLVLWASGMSGAGHAAGAFRQLRELGDWRIASEAITQTADHWDNPELAREHAEMLRGSVEPETYRRYMDSTCEWDLSPLLPEIMCPTLVIHPAANAYFPVEGARSLAAAIPNARLALVETRSVLMPGMEVIRQAGRFFLGGEPRIGPTARRTTASGTVIILFADIADSTGLTDRLGDDAFRSKARKLDDALRTMVRRSSIICSYSERVLEHLLADVLVSPIS